MVDGNSGKQFSSKYQPENRGRKQSALKKYVKDNGVSLQDVRLVFQNLIVKKMSEVKKLKEEADGLPAIIGFTVSALLRDYEAGKLDTFNSLIDRIWGKPMQQVEMSERTLDIPHDPEERRRLAEQIKTELGLSYTAPNQEGK
jgi:hypothetical protein